MRRFVACMVVIFMACVAHKAEAVSQWSRKYDVDCTMCHSAFPRLNAFGEEFMQNGFQMPGTEDGSEDGKMNIEERLALSQLVDIFGIRLNITPVEWKSNSRKAADGTLEDKLDFGNPNWLQLFTAGTIFKNVSIFIETEIKEEEIHTSWFTLGFHNLAGKGGLANIRMGRLSALEWHVMSGRLRQIPPVKSQVISGYKSSNGQGDDSVAIAAAYPALEYYGYTDKLVWALGVQNGAHSVDPNGDKNYFATVKVFLTKEGDFAGSAVSVASLFGTDTGVPLVANPADPTATVPGTVEAANEFWRVSPGINIRYKELTDLQLAYFSGSDDNWNLTTANPTTVDFTAITTGLSHWLNESYWVALQYDWIDSDWNPSDYEKITIAFYVFPMSNMRIGLIGRKDLDDVAEDVDELYVNLRTMF